MINIRRVGIGFFLLALAIAGLGFAVQNLGRSLGSPILDQLIVEFYANLGTELASIAVTLFFVDAIYDRRSEQREKADLVLQMGSPDNGFAREAVRKLRSRGWLQDGSLGGLNLRGADLSGADLSEADLSGADLSDANLFEAELSGVNLWGATMPDGVSYGPDTDISEFGAFGAPVPLPESAADRGIETETGEKVHK